MVMDFGNGVDQDNVVFSYSRLPSFFVRPSTKEIASDVSLALTFADGYSSNSPRLIPKEDTDAAGVASKIVPEAAAADDTCGFAEEAKKVRYIFFDSFYRTSFVFSIALI